MRVTNAIPSDLNEFPVDNQSGINKPIRKPMKAWQLNLRDSTLNQNRNSDLGNNQGRTCLKTDNQTELNPKLDDTSVDKPIKKVITLKKPVNAYTD